MYSSSLSLGPGGVDVLGNLTDKMAQQLKDTENIKALFDADIRNYKNNKMSKKEFVHKLVTYNISLSALNFLVMHVILEMRTAIEKGTPMKDTTGGTVLADSSTSTSGAQLNFGIEGFVGGSYLGGSTNSGDRLDISRGETRNSNESYTNTVPLLSNRGNEQGLSARKDQEDRKEQYDQGSLKKECPNCRSALLQTAKFCRTCGQKQ
jgi:hypothetical protein